MPEISRIPRKPNQTDRAGIRAGKHLMDITGRTLIMGVLNVTPDSFSDGGKFLDADTAVAHAVKMAGEGADIIDIGGESTRPGAQDVPVDEELRRIVPVVRKVSKEVAVPVSIDTRKSQVAEEAIEAGASIINDVSALNCDGRIADVAAKSRAALILMHMKGTPYDMQAEPRYDNIIHEIKMALGRSISSAKARGVGDDQIIVDPGIGFGKTVEHNLVILNRLKEFGELGHPVCVGVSRKSFIAKILELENGASRLAGTIAACVVSIMNGAKILRVHDVREIREAARISDAIMGRRG